MKRYLSFLSLTFMLALVGCDAMTAHTGVVARVGQQELTVDETVEMLAGNPRIPPQPEVVGMVADLWVDYMMLANLLAADSTLAELDLTAMVEPYVEQRLFLQLREQVMTQDTTISDEEVRAAFEEQAPGQRVRARHILLTYPEGAEEAARDSVRALAEELRARAEAGEDFAALAQEHSQDPGSARDGGNLGWFERGRMVQPFEEAAFALAPGEVSEVVETPFGLHIIKVEERETPTWDPAQGEQFRERLINQRRQESLSDYVEALREPVEVEVEAGATEVAKELAENPGERLRGRAAARTLVAWDGGSVTARDFVTMLRRMPPQQQAQYSSLQDAQMEEVLKNLATNQLVLADARGRGITVPEAEQDSVRDLIRTELQSLTQQAGLGGAPQEGETEAQAVERRVRSLLEGILAGRGNVVPLGALPYVMRDQFDWQVNESAFPEVVEELEARRADPTTTQPLPPAGAAPQPGAGAGQGGAPASSPTDTTG
jgi:peptidyl-prolyl cis-trans isomerase C